MNNAWFYFHVVLALIILVKDYNGTLEDALNDFEKKIGLYTPPADTTINAPPPFYIPPNEEEDNNDKH